MAGLSVRIAVYNNSVQKEQVVCFGHGTHHPFVPREPNKSLLCTHEVVKRVIFVYVVWVIDFLTPGTLVILNVKRVNCLN